MANWICQVCGKSVPDSDECPCGNSQAIAKRKNETAEYMLKHMKPRDARQKFRDWNRWRRP